VSGSVHNWPCVDMGLRCAEGNADLKIWSFGEERTEPFGIWRRVVYIYLPTRRHVAEGRNLGILPQTLQETKSCACGSSIHFYILKGIKWLLLGQYCEQWLYEAKSLHAWTFCKTPRTALNSGSTSSF
jgi:hypothetical protein